MTARVQPPSRPTAPRGRATVLATLLATLAGAACGTARPEPVAVDPPEARADSAAAEEGLGEIGELDPVAAPEPRRPWLPMGVRWSPTDPREGEAIGIRLSRPAAGRAPVDVEGDLGGRPVHFQRRGDEWFGVGAVPVGSSGPTELVLRFRLAPDSTVRQRVDLHVRNREFPATRLSVAPRYSDPSPEALARIREEREEIRSTLAAVTDRWLPRGPFAAPREARTTSPFGQRRLFNEELQSRHTGLDLAGRPGDPVHASARGEVALTGDFYFAGRAVFLDHGLGVYTAYFHLSQIDVTEGDTVGRGDRVGRVGSTGRVTGPHLHWSLYVGGESLDAASLLRMEVPCGGPEGGERPARVATATTPDDGAVTTGGTADTATDAPPAAAPDEDAAPPPYDGIAAAADGDDLCRRTSGVPGG